MPNCCLIVKLTAFRELGPLFRPVVLPGCSSAFRFSLETAGEASTAAEAMRMTAVVTRSSTELVGDDGGNIPETKRT